METAVWLEYIKGIAKFFIHPLFYFSVLITLLSGYLRVKRERRDFNIRNKPGIHELQSLFGIGALVGLLLSIIGIVVGFTLPFYLILAIMVSTILLTLIGHARLLTPALTIGLPLVTFYILDVFTIQISRFTFDWSSSWFSGIAIVLGLFILTEGILTYVNGHQSLSPKLRKSRRGLTVGAIQAKRFWLVPVLFFLPVGDLQPIFDWWPMFTFAGGEYTPILLPFLFGYQIQIQSRLPEEAIQQLAKEVIWLSVLVIAIAVAGLWLPTILPIIAVGLAMVGRLFISYRHRLRERAKPYYFTPLNDGMMILDVLSDSPAEKIGLKTGEIISTCNGIPVSNKDELYEALMTNRAYCKLEVFDVNKEKRLLQCALFEGDHHGLGILFVEKRKTPIG